MLDPRPMETAPRDHTMVRLLIDYTGTERHLPLEDEMQAWTIGSNGFDHTGIDEWQFVGWSWSQDVFVDATAPADGRPIGWLPLHDSTPLGLLARLADDVAIMQIGLPANGFASTKLREIEDRIRAMLKEAPDG